MTRPLSAEERQMFIFQIAAHTNYTDDALNRLSDIEIERMYQERVVKR